MFTFTWFLDALYFIISLTLCVFLVGYGMPKRKYFWVRFATYFAVMFGIMFLIRGVMYTYKISAFSPVGLLKYVIYFVIITIAVPICFDCNLWAAVFCSTVGYCMEHFAERLFELVNRPFMRETPLWAQYIVRTVIFVAVISALYFFLIKRSKYYKCNIIVDNKLQIITTVIAVGIIIFINSFAIRQSFGNIELGAYIHIMSLSLSFACIILELGLVSNKTNEEELAAVKYILREERKRWHVEKENMELLNIKYHDLKHQLMENENTLDREATESLRNNLALLEAHIDLGNDTLNIVIYKKMLECNKKDIQLTCMLDGKRFASFSAHDLFSLFGNAIDNAINAVRDLDKEKRLISITDLSREGFINVRIENYYEGDIVFEDGLPKTYQDTNYHGFGMKSMRYIAEKYGGVLRAYTVENIFILEILLPVIDICEV